MVSELKGSQVVAKLWCPVAEVESTALTQLRNIASLPWVAHVAVMPDVHYGKGATVGSVIAMRGAVAPAAVGVDIGCVDADMIDGHDPKTCGGANVCANCKVAVRRRFPRFPIPAGYDDESPHPPSIPWRIAELAYPVYASHGGSGQLLERLAERGGFGWDEFACFFAGHYPGRCQGTRGGGDRTKCRASALAAVERDAVALERRRIARLIQDAASQVGDDRGPVLMGVRDALLAIREQVLALEDATEEGA